MNDYWNLGGDDDDDDDIDEGSDAGVVWNQENLYQ